MFGLESPIDMSGLSLVPACLDRRQVPIPCVRREDETLTLESFIAAVVPISKTPIVVLMS